MISPLQWRVPMDLTTDPEWQQLAIYAVGAAVLLILLFNIPFIGRMLRALFSMGLLAFCLFILFQQAPYDPTLARVKSRLGLDDQIVSGKDVHIAMRRDGHFWARVNINGVERHMLVDSGATITALSQATADSASVERNANMMPVVMQTDNGAVRVETGSIDRLQIRSIQARNFKVVISSALGPVDILGMNFLSQIASWRAEGRTLILVPPSVLKEA